MAERRGPSSHGEVVLSEEDKARAARLQEEIAGRLQELYLIVGRNLGRTEGFPVAISFGPQAEVLAEAMSQQSSLTEATSDIGEQSRRGGAHPQLYHFVCIVDDQGNCGCEDPVRGICFSC